MTGRERVDRSVPHAVGDVVCRWPLRGDRHVHVGRVDDLAAHEDLGRLAAHRRGEADHSAIRPIAAGLGRTAAGGVRVERLLVELVHREVRHPPTRDELLVHHVVEVGDDFGTRRELVETGVPTVGVDPVAAQRTGVDPVERRGLVEPDERVGVVPVAARPVCPVDDHHGGVGLLEDDVGERHPHRAGADDEVVGFEHAPTVFEPCRGGGTSRRRTRRRSRLLGPVRKSDQHGSRTRPTNTSDGQDRRTRVTE